MTEATDNTEIPGNQDAPKTFPLRFLILMAFIFLLYFATFLYFTDLQQKDYDFFDSFYCSFITLSTIGLGDITPNVQIAGLLGKLKTIRISNNPQFLLKSFSMQDPQFLQKNFLMFAETFPNFRWKVNRKAKP